MSGPINSRALLRSADWCTSVVCILRSASSFVANKNCLYSGVVCFVALAG